MNDLHSPLRPSFFEHVCTALVPLVPLARRVAHVHGLRHARLVDVQDLVQELHETLAEASGWEAVLAQHLQVAGQLERLRDAADGFRLPSGACRSYARLYRELETLEAQLLRHLYLEQGSLRAS